MTEILPIFTSDASLGKSILTTDESKYDTLSLEDYSAYIFGLEISALHKECDKYNIKYKVKNVIVSETELRQTLVNKFKNYIAAPISIFSIAKHHQLDKIYLAENSMVSFMAAYKQADKLKKQLIFGIKFIVNSNLSDKSDNSTVNDSNVVIWMKNSDGYRDLIRLYSVINNNVDNYFWDKFNFKAIYRCSWDVLQRFITPNLLLTIPFYDSFLYKNLLVHGSMSVPEFGRLKPIFMLEKHELPFDIMLRESVQDFCKSHKYETQEAHSIYYYLKEDIKAFQIAKCIANRTSFEMPDMSYFCQDTFSFESYLDRRHEN